MRIGRTITVIEAAPLVLTDRLADDVPDLHEADDECPPGDTTDRPMSAPPLEVTA